MWFLRVLQLRELMLWKDINFYFSKMVEWYARELRAIQSDECLCATHRNPKLASVVPDANVT